MNVTRKISMAPLLNLMWKEHTASSVALNHASSLFYSSKLSRPNKSSGDSEQKAEWMLCPTSVSEAFIGCRPQPSSWILFARHTTKNSVNKAKQVRSIPEGFPNLNMKCASYDSSGRSHRNMGRIAIDQGNGKPHAGKLNWIRYSFINYLHLTTSGPTNMLKL